MSTLRFLQKPYRLATILTTGLLCLRAGAASPSDMLFPGGSDIGKPARAGSVEYNPAEGCYRVRGGGANMWFNRDQLHFIWTEVSGDVVLTADIRWLGSGGNAHRKACLILRQGLDPDAAYADAALHGDGLTSLQFREAKGDITREIQANVTAPARLRLERCGDFIWMSWAGTNGGFQAAGGAVRLPLKDPVLVGLGVCAHDDTALEEALFRNVDLSHPAHQDADRPRVASTLEVLAIDSRDRRAIYTAEAHFEAPNWSPDGRSFLFNQAGRIYRLPANGGTPEVIDTAFATRCNNDHGISPDGRQLVISDQSQTGKSLIYVLPVQGGTPRLVTPLGPSYWHGWSPDGTTIAYCAERGGEYDVYTLPLSGGQERRLTSAQGLDDGPDYSADGQWIYFNSDRAGRMQIWRMRPDGSAQEPLTQGEFNDWFPHPSPDGKWVVFLSYAADVVGHPENKDVMLRMIPAAGGPPQVLTRLFGGQGTLNVPSWAPDSKKVAFVSYRLIHH